MGKYSIETILKNNLAHVSNTFPVAQSVNSNTVSHIFTVDKSSNKKLL